MNDHTIGVGKLFSVNGQVQNILVFVDHTVSLAITQLCYCNSIVAIDIKCVILIEDIKVGQCDRNKEAGCVF